MADQHGGLHFPSTSFLVRDNEQIAVVVALQVDGKLALVRPRFAGLVMERTDAKVAQDGAKETICQKALESPSREHGIAGRGPTAHANP